MASLFSEGEVYYFNFRVLKDFKVFRVFKVLRVLKDNLW